MPNAKDFDSHQNPHRILITGLGGSGKSTEFLTLPGRKFAYVFDPNAMSAWEGHDIDYEPFIADLDDVEIAVQSLSKGKGDKSNRRISPRAYTDWEAHFEEHWEKGFFEAYDWVGFDSFTLFSDAVMDRILYINGRIGRQPEQDDWAAQVNTIGNVFRVFSSSTVGVFCTGHLDERQDELNKKIFYRPMMTGRLRVRIPLLFNSVFVCHASSDEQGPYWNIQTRPDRSCPIVRTSLKGLDVFEDVTIDDFNNPTEYGLGRILRKANALPTKQTVAKATRRK